MKIKLLCITLIAISFPSENVFAQIILNDGILCDGDFSTKTQEQKLAISLIGDTFKENNIDTGATCIGWSNLGAGDIWYEISTELKIYSANVNSKQYIGGWPITRWPNEYVEPEYIKWLGEYQNSMPDLNYNAYFATDTLGCLGVTPLRYGDINQDSTSELVLILGNTFSIFSTTVNRIIFAAELNHDDWFDADRTDNFIDRIQPDSSVLLPQYQSSESAGSVLGSRDIQPGHRGYAKLYFDDFDGDGKHDIVVWRKLYLSLMRNEATQGFKKISEILLHYTLIDGEYQRRETSEENIAQWLAARQLTWKSGYPSINECTDQKGQLISEMYDPLLNDPDVLQ